MESGGVSKKLLNQTLANKKRTQPESFQTLISMTISVLLQEVFYQVGRGDYPNQLAIVGHRKRVKFC